MDLRKDFAITKKVTYLDSSCMSLRPKQVVDAVNEYYNEYPGCAGRSPHKISKKVTEKVTEARRKIAKFINAKKVEEIIFTRNTTEAINLLVYSLKGKKVLLGPREHNSNLIPWLRHKNVEVINENEDHTIDMDDFMKKIKHVDILSIGWVSNLDGYVLPIEKMIKEAKRHDVKVIVDAAQAVPHMEVNVKKLGADFIAFSGHKMLGPSGTGVLWGKLEELEKLEPFLLGGDTVYDATFKDYKLEDVPARFEAGLQNYAGIIGLGAAVDYLRKVGMKKIEKHCAELNEYMKSKAKGLELVGVKDASKTVSVLSFNVPEINLHDVAMLLDAEDVAVRSGAHCVHAWFNKNNLNGSVRASAYIYNTKEDIDKFFKSLNKVRKVLG
jgi:cysteine desulfurase / selenocysteine lyase